MPSLTPSILDPLIPIIIAFLKQSGFDRKWNAWIAIAVYAVWTIISLVTGLRAVEGPITFEVIVSSFVTAAVTGFITYELILKNLPGDPEQALEHSTSVVQGPVSQPVIEDIPGDPGTNG